MNITLETQKALLELVSQCFVENRKLDRMVSVLNVDFACNNLSELIHQDIAHYFPKLADEIGALCLERYNISVTYGATPSGNEQYETVTSIIQTLEDRIISFQNMFIAVEKIALNNNDLNVFADLTVMLSDYNKIVEQVLLISDKMKKYTEERIMSMDRSAKDSFWILGEQK